MTNVDSLGGQPQSSVGGKDSAATTAAVNGNGSEKSNQEPVVTTSGLTPQGIAQNVAGVVAGAKDGRGETIDYVYFKRDHYAIYRCGPHVLVAYSDTKSVADQQIAAISGLLPLRDHLINLISDMPQKSAKDNYRAQIADALRLGLEKQQDVAKAIINEATRDALETQARIGRMVYLKWAAFLALVVAGALIPYGGTYVPDKSEAHLLYMATGAGAVGALLSIAIGIRGRTVAIDGNWRANGMDAAVRVLIGVISAAILFLLLNSGFVTNLEVGAAKLTGADIRWQTALLVGFAAGFLERLVPDLLEKSAPASKRPATEPPPTNSGGVVSPTGGTAGGQ
jgi:hypothetical protein